MMTPYAAESNDLITSNAIITKSIMIETTALQCFKIFRFIDPSLEFNSWDRVAYNLKSMIACDAWGQSFRCSERMKIE
jgi:hypothetical protein